MMKEEEFIIHVSDDEAMSVTTTEPKVNCEESCSRITAVNNLLSQKSKVSYETSYNRFLNWQRENDHAQSFSERVILTYFTHLSKKWKSSTLWSEFSKVAKMLKVKRNLDISDYRELKAFLKKSSVGYRPKKSKTLTSQEIDKFLNEAPDWTYLATKVAMIFGVLGSCRKDELIRVETTHLKTYFESNDTEKKQPTLLVHILDTEKNRQEREFAIKGKYYDYYERYNDLRPNNICHDRFFLNYKDGKCTVQPIGEKKFAVMPKSIARFLKLPDPESYTGHPFRRNSAIRGAEYGNDVTDANKQHDGWKSTTVVENSTLWIKEETINETSSSSEEDLYTVITEYPVDIKHEYFFQNEVKQESNSTAVPSSSKAGSSTVNSTIFTPPQSVEENLGNNSVKQKPGTLNRNRPKQTAGSSGRRQNYSSSLTSTILGTKSERAALINQVRKYSLLYDKTDGHYGNTKRRDRAWYSIGRNLHMSITRCVERWRAICGKLCREKKLASEGTVSLSSIEFMRSMSFLPSMKETMERIPEISTIYASSESSCNRIIEPNTSNHQSAGSGTSAAAANLGLNTTAAVVSSNVLPDQSFCDDVAQALQYFSPPVKNFIKAEIWKVIANANCNPN